MTNADHVATETRHDIVTGNGGDARAPAQRRSDRNEIHLRKRTDVDKLNELSGVQAKGRFSVKYVEDNLVKAVCDALEKINREVLVVTTPMTLETVVEKILTHKFVLTRMAWVASAYQSRSPNAELYQVLLPLDPLDRDVVQQQLAVIVVEIVRRIPSLVPDARGVYDGICTGFGNRPPELTGPANPPPTEGETDQTSE